MHKDVDFGLTFYEFSRARDLVEPRDDTNEAKKLDVKNSPDGGTYVPGLCVTKVASMQDVCDVLRRGESNRSTGATNMNEHSSRSHMVLSVHVQVRYCSFTNVCNSTAHVGLGSFHG